MSVEIIKTLCVSINNAERPITSIDVELSNKASRRRNGLCGPGRHSPDRKSDSNACKAAQHIFHHRVYRLCLTGGSAATSAPMHPESVSNLRWFNQCHSGLQVGA